MDSVLEFAKCWGSESTDHTLMDKEVLSVFASHVGENLKNSFYNIYLRHLTDNTNTHSTNFLRASMLDSHSLILLSQKFLEAGDRQTDRTFTRKSKLTMNFGTLFEHLAMMEMLLDGWELEETQAEVLLMDGLVSGHPDLIAKTPKGERVIIEFKTMNQDYWSQISSSRGSGMDNERGYIMQLALYQDALQLPAYWLCFNKNTSEMYAEKLTPRKSEPVLQRAKRKIEVYKKCSSWDEMFLYAKIPEPVAEIYKGESTGRYFVPLEFRGTAVGDWIYETVQDTNGYNQPRDYVTKICVPEIAYEKQHKHLAAKFDSFIEVVTGNG